MRGVNGVVIMADPATNMEIERRIAAVRENLRQLTEQATAFSGAADESRTADRIAEQEARLAELLTEQSEAAKA
jgi:hypothetical protein